MSHLNDFYPTPTALIDRMLAGIGNLAEYEPILEPSAGKGDICDRLPLDGIRRGPLQDRTLDLDVIELDPNLQHVLRGKGYNLVHDDFLSFTTHKRYGLIIANFPFSDGDQHLAKAMHMVERDGGKLVCLVNAETLRNPYTNRRKALAASLDTHGAEIEYIADAFTTAERPTDVEVAMIRVTVPQPKRESVLLDELERAEEIAERDHEPTALAETDLVRSMVQRFNLECQAGVRLIDEYEALKPLMLRDLPKPGTDTPADKPIIELTVNGGARYSTAYANDYVRETRRKYWAVLIANERISSVYTSNVLSDLEGQLETLKDADFSEFNIRALFAELSQSVGFGVESAIIAMFDEFSRKYAWEQHGDNIHYYNGWKTNKSYRVNKKIILPIDGFASGYSSIEKLNSYYVRDRIGDMVKAFNYLAGDLDDIGGLVKQAFDIANDVRQFRNIDFHYFTATFYKKGTCHIAFKDEKLLDKFNIYGSQRKGWLPPGYGQQRYADMDAEAQQVIDEFQGEAAYAEVLRDTAYYLAEPGQLMLSEGVAS